MVFLMKVYGYVTFGPSPDSHRRTVLHRSVNCHALMRSEGIYDGSVWLDKKTGKTFRDKYSDEEWTLCQMPSCSPTESFDSTLAACGPDDHELFFPSNVTDGQAAYREARQICARCPIESACLQFALDEGLGFGMFGGMSPTERRKYKDNLRLKELARA